MNDHNLDDLILHDIPPIQNGKGKSLLTIIALFLIVLIVAILLIKTLFSSPDADDIVVEDSASYRSSDLELQAPKKEIVKPKAPVTKKTSVKKPSVKKPAVAKVKEHIKEKTVSINEAAKKAVAPVVKKPAAKVTPEAKKPELKKPAVVKPTTQNKAATTNEKFFIQVGSFTKDPSDRFLSVIKNSGFNYSIADNSLSGTKKLLIGPYEDRASVNAALVKVRDRISKSAFVVKN
jgi:DedD protein